MEKNHFINLSIEMRRCLVNAQNHFIHFFFFFCISLILTNFSFHGYCAKIKAKSLLTSNLYIFPRTNYIFIHNLLKITNSLPNLNVCQYSYLSSGNRSLCCFFVKVTTSSLIVMTLYTLTYDNNDMFWPGEHCCYVYVGHRFSLE